MSRLDKLIEKIRARPPEADFNDVCRLLEAFGWTMGRRDGSHVVFVKPDEFPITVPLVGGRRVRRTYLDQICKLLGLDD